MQIRSGAPGRRCLVVSIGPDQVLNFLDGGDCIRADGVPALRAQCVPAPTVGRETLGAWLRGVFQANDYCEDHGYPEVTVEEEGIVTGVTKEEDEIVTTVTTVVLEEKNNEPALLVP